MKQQSKMSKITEDDFQCILDQELESGGEREESILHKVIASEKCFTLAKKYASSQTYELQKLHNELVAELQIRNDELKEKIQRHTDNNLKLTIESNELQKLVEEFKLANRILDNTNDTLNETIALLNRMVEEKDAELSSYRSLLDDAVEEVQLLKQEVETKDKQIAFFKKAATNITGSHLVLQDAICGFEKFIQEQISLCSLAITACGTDKVSAYVYQKYQKLFKDKLPELDIETILLKEDKSQQPKL